MSTITIRIVFLTFTGLFCLAVNGNAQKGYFRDMAIRDGEDFNFRVFSHGHEDQVSTRINQLIQLEELYSLAKPPYSSHMFDQSKANDGSIYGGKVWLWTTVYSNNNRLLSLGFEESACGATCGYWSRYYNFNSGNGDRISLKDIFTAGGYSKFFKLVLEKRSLKYRREVKEKVEPKYQESYLDTLGCIEHDDLSDFYIRGKSIVIDGENCLIKGQKFDGLDMTVAIALSKFRKHLNTYGQTLFGLQNSDISEFRSTELPQLLEGTVNGVYPIVMVLSPEFELGYRGYYAYLKYGEAISIRGSKKDNQLELTEYILSPAVTRGPLGEIRKTQENGYVSGELTGLIFDGFWSDLARSKRLTFYAAVK